VTGTRKTNPAIELHELPNIDVFLLSHYHAYDCFPWLDRVPFGDAHPIGRDHFDQKVEASLRRDLPIITTPHARSHLQGKEEGEAFSNVHDLDFFHSMMVDVIKEDDESKKSPSLKVTAMPGKHVPDGVLGTLNDFIQAVSLRNRDTESRVTDCQ
jgi:hypothetical protein